MKTYRDIAGDGGSDVLGQVTERAARMRARMALVARKLAVMSGKGGVGKSVVTVNLAAALAMRGRKVGILDADLNGPSIARMLGIENRRLTVGGAGLVPAVGPFGTRVVSMDLLLSRQGAPVAWDAPALQHRSTWLGALEASALGELLGDTAWGELDFLLIDLPPGPERFPVFDGLFPECDGAIAVTIPSAVAALTVRRSVVLARRCKAGILGAVENMAGYRCPCCGARQALFAEEGESVARTLGVPVLGSIPFDPRIARCADQGVPFVAAHRDTPAARAIVGVVEQIDRTCAGQEASR